MQSIWLAALTLAALVSPSHPHSPVRAPSAATPGDSVARTLFAYDAAAPLVLQDSLLETEEGVQVRAFRFASPRGGLATGRLYVPARAPGSPRLAGIVLGHGTGSGSRTQGPKAVYLARHGAVVVVVDAPFVRRGGPALRFTPADSAELAQSVVDQRRAVDLLAARADVDPARVAYVGHSYGAMVGALLSGVEPRIATYVLSAGDAGPLAHMASAAELPPEYAALSPAARRIWEAALGPFDATRMVGRASAAPLLFQHGRADRTVPPESAARLHAAARDPHTVLWYDAGHRIPTAAYRDQLAWLARTVGTTPPGDDAAAGPRFPTRPAR